jgi:Zn-dependent protease
MKGHARLGPVRVFGAPVHVHWSVAVVVLALLATASDDWLIGVVAVLSYLAIIVIHEMGHAYFARRVGTRPTKITIGFIHGLCYYEDVYDARDEAIIAWGGVIAQATVGVPLVLLNAFFGFGNMDPFGPVIAYLGYFSLIFAVFNLIPAPGLDGGKAWKLVPILISDLKAGRIVKRARKPRKFKVVK